jgi:hypothetical protein
MWHDGMRRDRLSCDVRGRGFESPISTNENRETDGASVIYVFRACADA